MFRRFLALITVVVISVSPFYLTASVAVPGIVSAGAPQLILAQPVMFLDGTIGYIPVSQPLGYSAALPATHEEMIRAAFNAITRRDVEALQTLLARGGESILLQDHPEDKIALIHFASGFAEHEWAVPLILDHAARREAACLSFSLIKDLQATRNHGESPLHCATIRKKWYLVQRLLDYGARAYTLDKLQRTPLLFICSAGPREDGAVLAQVARSLILNIKVQPELSEKSDLHLHARKLTADELVEGQKHYVNHSDIDGHTPLFEAIKSLHPDLVSVLLEFGASTVHLSTGESALSYLARIRQDVDLIEDDTIRQAFLARCDAISSILSSAHAPLTLDHSVIIPPAETLSAALCSLTLDDAEHEGVEKSVKTHQALNYAEAVSKGKMSLKPLGRALIKTRGHDSRRKVARDKKDAKRGITTAAQSSYSSLQGDDDWRVVKKGYKPRAVEVSDIFAERALSEPKVAHADTPVAGDSAVSVADIKKVALAENKDRFEAARKDWNLRLMLASLTEDPSLIMHLNIHGETLLHEAVIRNDSLALKSFVRFAIEKTAQSDAFMNKKNKRGETAIRLAEAAPKEIFDFLHSSGAYYVASALSVDQVATGAAVGGAGAPLGEASAPFLSTPAIRKILGDLTSKPSKEAEACYQAINVVMGADVLDELALDKDVADSYKRYSRFISLPTSASHIFVRLTNWYKTASSHDRLPAFITPASITELDKHGYALVHYLATSNAYEDLLALCLRSLSKSECLGAATVSGTFGLQPLHVAADYNSHRIIGLFSELNVDINGRDVFGRNPMYVAAMAGSIESCRLLLSLHVLHGTDPAPKIKDCKSLLHILVEAPQARRDQYFATRDEIGRTASATLAPVTSSYARSITAHAEVLELLLRQRSSCGIADQSAYDHFGRSPYASLFNVGRPEDAYLTLELPLWVLTPDLIVRRARCLHAAGVRIAYGRPLDFINLLEAFARSAVRAFDSDFFNTILREGFEHYNFSPEVISKVQSIFSYPQAVSRLKALFEKPLPPEPMLLGLLSGFLREGVSAKILDGKVISRDEMALITDSDFRKASLKRLSRVARFFSDSEKTNLRRVMATQAASAATRFEESFERDYEPRVRMFEFVHEAELLIEEEDIDRLRRLIDELRPSDRANFINYGNGHLADYTLTSQVLSPKRKQEVISVLMNVEGFDCLAPNADNILLASRALDAGAYDVYNALVSIMPDVSMYDNQLMWLLIKNIFAHVSSERLRKDSPCLHAFNNLLRRYHDSGKLAELYKIPRTPYFKEIDLIDSVFSFIMQQIYIPLEVRTLLMREFMTAGVNPFCASFITNHDMALSWVMKTFSAFIIGGFSAIKNERTDSWFVLDIIKIFLFSRLKKASTVSAASSSSSSSSAPSSLAKIVVSDETFEACERRFHAFERVYLAQVEYHITNKTLVGGKEFKKLMKSFQDFVDYYLTHVGHEALNPSLGA